MPEPGGGGTSPAWGARGGAVPATSRPSWMHSAPNRDAARTPLFPPGKRVFSWAKANHKPFLGWSPGAGSGPQAREPVKPGHPPRHLTASWWAYGTGSEQLLLRGELGTVHGGLCSQLPARQPGAGSEIRLMGSLCPGQDRGHEVISSPRTSHACPGIQACAILPTTAPHSPL